MKKERPVVRSVLIGLALVGMLAFGPLASPVSAGTTVLWDTGAPNNVLFNGDPSTVGLSSGNLGDGLEQRWCAAPFTLTSAATITNVNAWVYSHVSGDTEKYIIWSRTGLNQPVDGDQVISGTLGAFPTSGTFQQYSGLSISLPAGDYYMTIYGAKADGTACNSPWIVGGLNVPTDLERNGVWRSATFPAGGFADYHPANIAPDTSVSDDPFYCWNPCYQLIQFSKESFGTYAWKRTDSGAGLWTDAGNWTDGVPGATEVAWFSNDTATQASVDLGSGGDVTVKGLSFNANVNNINIADTSAAGTKLILNGAGSAAAITIGSGQHTISAPVQLDSDVSVAAGTDSTNKLTIAGQITGSNALSLSGSGMLVLSGDNSASYSGAITAESGTLVLGNPNGFGSATVTLAGGSGFHTSNFEGNGSGGALPNAFVLSGGPENGGKVNVDIDFANKDIWITTSVSGPGGFSITGSGREQGLTLSGAKTFEGGVTVYSAATVSIDNVDSLGTGTLRAGSGTATLRLAGSVTDGAGVENAVEIAAGATLKVKTNGNDLLLSGGITGDGQLYKTTNGTLTLAGNNDYTGGTRIDTGTLALSGIGKLGAGALTADGGTAIVDLGGTAQTVGAVSLKNGAQINSGTLAGASFAVENGSASAILAGVGAILTKTTADTVALSGVNTYTGNTDIQAGALSLADNAGLKFVIGASGVNNKITGTSSGTVSLDGDFTFDLTYAGTTVGNQWTIVDVGALSAAIFGETSFTVVDFTDIGGDKWTKTISFLKAYEFSESTGILQVKLTLVPGDANKDGVVDAADYITVKQNFGMPSGAQWSDGDFNENGTVDWTDLQTLIANFGTRSVGGAPAAPEPATLGLLAIGAAALLRRRRK